MGVAFFDLDRTVFAMNSAALWLQQEVRAGHLPRIQALRAAIWVVAYSLGLLSVERAVRRAIGTLEGSDSGVLRDRTIEFFQQHLREGYRPGALAALEAHRRRGDRVVLLTASSSYLAKLVAEDLRLDGFLCNELEVDDRGLHTGRTVGELCFGRGKLCHAQAYADLHAVSLDDCVFYTDSYTDLPLLRRIGRPVAVNPDRRLRREAHRRGWEVVDWGDPHPRPSLPPPRVDPPEAPQSLHPAS